MTRIGLIARADHTGLAIQTWCFWRNMKPARTLVVDLSRCSGQHPDMSMYEGDPNVSVWKSSVYPDVRPLPEQILEDFLDDVDAVFTCETPYNTWLFQRAAEKGVKTVLQPNFEFLDFTAVPQPDVYALPSLWHVDDIKSRLSGRDIIYLPVPVDTELLPYRQRTELKTILHTAGVQAMKDRNGTMLFLEAMKFVKTPVHALVRSQGELPTRGMVMPGNVRYDFGPKRWFYELYGDQDLYVMPRRFGGLCLPMQEALALGMPTLMTGVPPQKDFLPAELLVQAYYEQSFEARSGIDVFSSIPQDIAARIDWLYENPDRFAQLSEWAGQWARMHSWEALKWRYEKLLSSE